MATIEVGIDTVDGSSARGVKITTAVVVTCIVAASGGLIFGYDIGISGGVTTMEPFLEKFFPSVLEKAKGPITQSSIYCVYDSQALTAFTSSLYIAGLITSLMAGHLTAAFGRRNIMILGGISFLSGAAINSGAENIAMLIIGRILLGFGVGFTNQATPVYLSEIAPPKWRGAFNTGFQFFIGIGVVTANLINFGTAKINWGWRLSLGLATVPAAIITIGSSCLISDTPSSLVQRGKLEEAKKSLIRIRGETNSAEIEQELLDIANSSKEVGNGVVNRESFATIFETEYRPHLVMSIAIPFFQQVTGINIVAFYAPVLFQSVGFGNNSALIGAIILGAVNLASIVVSTAIVDRFGRRFMFFEGGVQMFTCQIAIAFVLGFVSGVSGNAQISKGSAALILALMCLYSAGFGWSWGPLSWLIPSEIFPLKIRTTGQSISVAVNFATTFVLSQTFLTMLCHFKYGAFVFYACWIVVMTVFIAIFMPETKGIPLHLMHEVWEQHWFWTRFVRHQPQ